MRHTEPMSPYMAFVVVALFAIVLAGIVALSTHDRSRFSRTASIDVPPIELPTSLALPSAV